MADEPVCGSALRFETGPDGKLVSSVLFKGCTAAEWAELYERREAEFQQARSEADDALVKVAKLEGELRQAVGDRDQARDEAARLSRVNREMGVELGKLMQGKSVPPERSAGAVETLSEVRHLMALAGELRAALAPFCGGR